MGESERRHVMERVGGRRREGVERVGEEQGERERYERTDRA